MKKFFNALRREALYIPLMAVYPAVFLWGENPGQAQIDDTIFLAVILCVALLAVYFCFRVMKASVPKAGVAGVFVWILFWSFGHISNAVETHLSKSKILGGFENDHYLVFGFGIVLLMGLFAIKKTKSGIIQRFHEMLPVFSIVLFVMVGLGVLTKLDKIGAGIKAREGFRLDQTLEGNKESILGYNPDIYMLILDGYTRDDVFKKYYNFDNSKFYEELKNTGFQNGYQNHGNFFWTFLSLSSSLNMVYVDFLRAIVGSNSKSRTFAYEAIQNNNVSKILKRKGYKIVHISSTWGGTGKNPYADEVVSCTKGAFQNELFRVVAESTLLKLWNSEVTSDIANCHLQSMESFKAQASKDGVPKFVFLHLMPPHHPYLFDQDGNILRFATVSNQFEFQKNLWSDQSGYTNQVKFINKKTIEMSKAIVANSKRPPVILIHADHGTHLDYLDIDTEVARKGRFKAFASFYFPDKAVVIPEGASNVNYFRYVFNHYFGAKFPILENRVFYSGYKRPYRMRQVDLPQSEYAAP